MVPAASAIREMRTSSVSVSHRPLQRLQNYSGWANGLSSEVIVSQTNGRLPMGPHYSPDVRVASGSALGFSCVCFEYVPTFWQTL